MVSAAATRAQIVEAADRLFYRHGFEHTSSADIADAVGLSRGNFSRSRQAWPTRA